MEWHRLLVWGFGFWVLGSSLKGLDSVICVAGFELLLLLRATGVRQSFWA